MSQQQNHQNSLHQNETQLTIQSQHHSQNQTKEQNKVNHQQQSNEPQGQIRDHDIHQQQNLANKIESSQDQKTKKQQIETKKQQSQKLSIGDQRQQNQKNLQQQKIQQRELVDQANNVKQNQEKNQSQKNHLKDSRQEAQYNQSKPARLGHLEEWRKKNQTLQAPISVQFSAQINENIDASQEKVRAQQQQVNKDQKNYEKLNQQNTEVTIQNEQKLIQVSGSQEFQNIELSQSNDMYEVLQASKSFSGLQLNNEQSNLKVQNNQINLQKTQDSKIKPEEKAQKNQNQLQNTIQDPLQYEQHQEEQNIIEKSQAQISGQQIKPQTVVVQPTKVQSTGLNNAIKEEQINFKHFQNKINQAIVFKTAGNNCFKLQLYQQAVKQYSQGLRILDPKHFYGATAAQLNKMVELTANLFLNIGSCFFNLNIWRNAQIYFSQAITVNPNYTKAIYKRALCRYELQNYESAMEDIKTAFAQDKSNEQIYASYQKILLKYNQQIKRDKESLKEMSSKIFRSDSQKSLSAKSQNNGQNLSNSQIKPKGQQKQNQQIDQGPSELWSLAPIALVIGVGLFWGYKKLFGKS